MVTPEDHQICAHACEVCDAVTLRWIQWQNARGDQRYFCDNDCLAGWLAQQHRNAVREGVLECQQA